MAELRAGCDGPLEEVSRQTLEMMGWDYGRKPETGTLESWTRLLALPRTQQSWDFWKEGFRLHASQRSSSPPQLGPFQGHLDVHVVTAVVSDDDVEVWVAGDLEQRLHVSDELLYPACLVLHYPRGTAREKEAEVTQSRASPLLVLPESGVPSHLCLGVMQLQETWQCSTGMEGSGTHQ